MSELSYRIDGVKYEAIEENHHDSCGGCCASNDYYLCHRLMMHQYKCSGIYHCNGIIWIKEETKMADASKETEMTKEQKKENQQTPPKTKHIHADLMLEYAKEAMQSETPWDAFEYKDKDGVWKDCIGSPSWYKDSSFRKKT